MNPSQYNQNDQQKYPPPPPSNNYNQYYPPPQQPFMPQSNMAYFPPPNYPPSYATNNHENQRQAPAAPVNQMPLGKNTNVVENSARREIQNKFEGIREKFSRLNIRRDFEQKPETISSEKKADNLVSGQLSQKEILRLIWPCMIFKVQVIEKKDDRLFVILKELLSFAYDGESLPDDKYDYDDFKSDIIKVPKVVQDLKKIRAYQIKGQIKKYDVEETNLLSYFISYVDIRKDDYLIAIVKRKEDSLVCMSLKNSCISGCKQRKFEEYVPNQRHDNSSFQKLGFADLPKAERSVLGLDPFFEEELNFPNNNFFDITSSNDAEYDKGLSSLEIKDPNITLRTDTNGQVLVDLKMDYRKIREIQNKVWGMESLNQGIELTQHQLYEEAIAFFDNAISMDETLVDAYVAKACALSNMEKYHEGIKLLTKALDIDPEHKDAKKYYEAVQAKIKELEKDVFKIDDQTKVTLIRTKKPQTKESTSLLILSDEEDDKSKRKPKKKK